MKTTNNAAIDQFIIEAILVSPIEKILSQLNEGQFRDCDIKWLDSKLETFVDFAAKTFGIKTATIRQAKSVKPAYMNDYAKQYYTKYFNSLLNYFKSL
jgi:hypothetical protein